MKIMVEEEHRMSDKPLDVECTKEDEHTFAIPKDTSGDIDSKQPITYTPTGSRPINYSNVQEITQAEYNNFSRIFKAFDKDGSGSIDVHELKTVMQALGIFLNEDEIKELMAHVDLDGSGAIDFDEFLQLMLHNQEVYNMQRAHMDSESAKHVLAAIRSKHFFTDSYWHLVWDIIMLASIIYYTVAVTMRDVWDHQYIPIWCDYIEIAWTILFFIDIGIHFNTAYMDSVTLVSDFPKIVSNYLKGWFVVDLLASFPLDLICRYNGPFWLGIVFNHVRLIRVFRVHTMFAPSSIEGRMTPYYVQIYYYFVPILRLIFWSILIVHVFAVIHLMTAIKTNPNDAAYGDSLYFVIYTISTCGYGDIPVNGFGQKAFASSLCVVSILINGMVVGKLSVVFQNSALQSEHHNRMRDTLAVLNYFNIPRHLQDEILAFQHHVQEHNLSRAYVTVIESLPENMQDQLGLYVRIKYISMVPLFWEASHECKVALAQSLRNLVVPPNEFIIVAGEEGRELFFLGHGFADVILPDGTYVSTIKKGMFFGEMALLVETSKRAASVRALTYCDLFTLDKQDFRVILKRFPKFQEVIEFESMKRKAEMSNNQTESEIETKQRAQSRAWLNQMQKLSDYSHDVVTDISKVDANSISETAESPINGNPPPPSLPTRHSTETHLAVERENSRLTNLESEMKSTRAKVDQCLLLLNKLVHTLVPAPLLGTELQPGFASPFNSPGATINLSNSPPLLSRRINSNYSDESRKRQFGSERNLTIERNNALSNPLQNLPRPTTSSVRRRSSEVSPVNRESNFQRRRLKTEYKKETIPPHTFPADVNR